jgi:hypothetical protein
MELSGDRMGGAVVNQAILAWSFKKVPYFSVRWRCHKKLLLKNLYLASTFVVPTIKSKI